MSRILHLALVVLIAAGLTACGRSDDYPSRPITLIVPWAPGGGTDRIARQLAVELEAELDIPVNVVNAVGGGGVLGHTRGAVARPDGYTLTFATAELNMLHWRNITPLNYLDFEPVLLVNRDDAAILVPIDSPWRSASELADSIRSRPRTLLASGTAFGGIWHLAVAGWLTGQGIPPANLTWISMNSAQPAFQEMMAGRLDVVVTSLPEAKPMIEAGSMRPLALMADERHSGFPDVPTLREQGIDWSMGTWRGVLLPRDVPADRVARLKEALKAVTADPEFLEFMRAAGFAVTPIEGAEFDQYLEQVEQRSGSLLTSASFITISDQQFGLMFFPAVIGIVLATLLILHLALRRRAGAPTPAESLVDRELTSFVPQKPRYATWVRTGLPILWIASLVLLWERLGFVVSTAMVLCVWLLSVRVRWTVAIPVGAVVAAVIFQLFAVTLGVPLPWGVLGW